MINKQDILDRAAEWQLRAEVVEKDYVLGWLLAAISSHPELRALWIFKGGTCIKKTYFETYRFSEDLDFTLLPEAPYSEGAILEQLQAMARIAAEMSGLELPTELIRVLPRHNKAGQDTFQGRLYYRGPLQRTQNYASIIFDITNDETVFAEPVARTVFHPYSDGLPADVAVQCYSLEELLAEKTRALYQRTRPRDLYDVVYLLENCIDAIDLAEAQRIFGAKCESKGLPIPSSDELLVLVKQNEELRADWANMLAHQLPNLPEIEGTLARFASLIGWIDKPEFVPAEAALGAAVPASTDYRSIPLSGIRYWGGGSPVERIRFAGANRLLLEFGYHGKHRLVEPYSLREAKTTGNILLYAWELSSGHIKAFKIAEMDDVRTTNTGFTPRYRVELSAQGPMSIPDVSRSTGVIRSPRLSARRKSSAYHGPIYVYECSYCGKRFRRQQRKSQLKPHKDKHGWDCPGRTAYFVDTIY
ncbi:MAG: nucleotidyl transferase AbiEii/AbiGii toxin family protein [Acidobacteriota bacterium]|nr:nucleotidyl transferase AbiEii/AbiGii toxin family protein [Acidobacteriota bacterium]